jgi:hypothetical protein
MVHEALTRCPALLGSAQAITELKEVHKRELAARDLTIATQQRELRVRSKRISDLEHTVAVRTPRPASSAHSLAAVVVIPHPRAAPPPAPPHVYSPSPTRSCKRSWRLRAQRRPWQPQPPLWLVPLCVHPWPAIAIRSSGGPLCPRCFALPYHIARYSPSPPPLWGTLVPAMYACFGAPAEGPC